LPAKPDSGTKTSKSCSPRATRGMCWNDIERWTSFRLSTNRSAWQTWRGACGQSCTKRKIHKRNVRLRPPSPVIATTSSTRRRVAKCQTRTSRTQFEMREVVNRDGFARSTGVQFRLQRLLVTPHDVYGLLAAVAPRNRYGLGGATRHIRSVRRYDSRRVSMCPIPGNIVGIGVTNIV
jgi:hypothetical protein